MKEGPAAENFFTSLDRGVWKVDNTISGCLPLSFSGADPGF